MDHIGVVRIGYFGKTTFSLHILSSWNASIELVISVLLVLLISDGGEACHDANSHSVPGNESVNVVRYEEGYNLDESFRWMRQEWSEQEGSARQDGHLCWLLAIKEATRQAFQVQLHVIISSTVSSCKCAATGRLAHLLLSAAMCTVLQNTAWRASQGCATPLYMCHVCRLSDHLMCTLSFCTKLRSSMLRTDSLVCLAGSRCYS